jgi:hypothetical protein
MAGRLDGRFAAALSAPRSDLMLLIPCLVFGIIYVHITKLKNHILSFGLRGGAFG